VGKGYLAGLLAHSPAFTLITNQWVNSYKRLVPGYEAPVYLSWAQRNRSDLVRIPTYKPGKENATRFELRSPDPSCNPYLAFAVMLAAGLDGIEKGLTPPDPIEENIYEMTPQRRKELNITQLPEDLWEAIKVTEKSSLIRECLGDHVFENFITNKTIEWEKYRAQVTNYELEQNLSVL
jgi:glutamine synthetase